MEHNSNRSPSEDDIGRHTSVGIILGFVLGVVFAIAVGPSFGVEQHTALSYGSGMGVVFGIVFGAALDQTKRSDDI